MIDVAHDGHHGRAADKILRLFSKLDVLRALFFVADLVRGSPELARQLLGNTAWAENPRSLTRRLITNVRIVSVDDTAIRATANFMIQRSRMERIVSYVGQYRYKLVRSGDSFKFAERIVILDDYPIEPAPADPEAPSEV